MKAFQIGHDFSPASGLEVDYSHVGDFANHSRLVEGVPLEPSYLAGFRLDAKSDGPLPVFLPNPLNWPLIRSSAAGRSTMITRAVGTGGIQLLETDVWMGGKAISYSVINVLAVVDCLDLHASCLRYEEDEEGE